MRKKALPYILRGAQALIIAAAALLVVLYGGVRLVGLTPYAVLSGSMEPELPVGSLILVAGVDPADVEEGDTIAFSTESGAIVTHQVYEVSRERRIVRTQGIANRDSEGRVVHDASPVPFDRVVGEPVAVIPYLGYANRVLTGAGAPFIALMLVAATAALGIAASLAAPEEEGPIGTHMRR